MSTEKSLTEKSLGQVAYEARQSEHCKLNDAFGSAQEGWQRAADAVVAEHERRCEKALIVSAALQDRRRIETLEAKVEELRIEEEVICRGNQVRELRDKGTVVERKEMFVLLQNAVDAIRTTMRLYNWNDDTTLLSIRCREIERWLDAHQ